MKEKIVSGILTLSTIATPSSMELMLGTNAAYYDTKINCELTKNTNFFIRNYISVDYQNNVSPISLAYISHNLGKGFSAEGIIRASPGLGVISGIGMGYIKKKGNGFFSIKNTINPDVFRSDVVMSYSRDIGEKTKWSAYTHGALQLDRQGLNFGLLENRVGLNKGNYTAGLSLDIKKNNKSKASFNPGVFFNKKF